jgi:hypothetical protein
MHPCILTFRGAWGARTLFLIGTEYENRSLFVGFGIPFAKTASFMMQKWVQFGTLNHAFPTMNSGYARCETDSSAPCSGTRK